MKRIHLGKLAALAVLLLILTATPAFARGSFGGGGHAFGGGFGGSRSFGGGFGGSHSFGGGRGFGGLFGRSRSSFTPAPRPSFTPPPRPFVTPEPAPRSSFTPAPVPASPGVSVGRSPSPALPAGSIGRPSSGSFGRAGGVGSPVSNRFSATAGSGGSFGRTGAAGSRSFTSIGSHPYAAPAPPPAATRYFGQPLAPTFAHPYYYGGHPANVYFTGGYPDYSFGYYRHPYLGFFPWSPVFFYNPPIYTGSGYVSGGFSFIRFLIGIVFWVAVIAVVVAVFKRLGRQDVR
jgi:hypothetical protein